MTKEQSITILIVLAVIIFILACMIVFSAFVEASRYDDEVELEIREREDKHDKH